MNGSIVLDLHNGKLLGEQIKTSTTYLRDLRAAFANFERWQSMDPDTLVYQVQFWRPVGEGTEGGLFWGSSVVQPGRVGNEYFMTKGHFHKRRNRAEYYATVQGEGYLLLMDEQRRTTAQRMRSGTVHYIPGFTAHRVANTGNAPLVFLACWPSDAGHDYRTIEEHGFSARLLSRDGQPELVPAE